MAQNSLAEDRKTQKEPPQKRAHYHHGDLKAALLKAGEDVLAETGVEGFSLRQVARKVGVSHSAPAHHFGDANGLLSAMATDGFRRFLAAMQARQEQAGDDDREKLIASGLGYLDFALESPALFKLMFGSDRIDTLTTDELADASKASFMHLVDDHERLSGKCAFDDQEVMARMLGSWSMVHGFATLYLSGKMFPVQAMSAEEREEFFRQLYAPVVPN